MFICHLVNQSAELLWGGVKDVCVCVCVSLQRHQPINAVHSHILIYRFSEVNSEREIYIWIECHKCVFRVV